MPDIYISDIRSILTSYTIAARLLTHPVTKGLFIVIFSITGFWTLSAFFRQAPAVLAETFGMARTTQLFSSVLLKENKKTQF